MGMLMRLPFFRRDQSARNVPIQLLPLTPSYDEASHEVYFRAIESALTGKDQKAIRNIALTGSYGVGKSSILQKIAERHENEVVQISLSTLGLSDQATITDPASNAVTSKTNRIQKEIVKQLLYREEPVKMPGSRYRRLERFKFWRALRVAALVAIALSLVFYLTGWTTKIDALAKHYYDFGVAIHLVVYVVATVFLLAFEVLFHNRVRVERLSAGAATISLSADAATFFDEYLDEIVYFFDVTGRNVVIFEDIDRFDDPHIFETLRALNTLLNGANQLKGRNIRFIYAIRDSIFDALGARAALEEGDDFASRVDAADSELARANRTKFFDLVIPVVPFITHRSARDLMVRVMDEIDHKVPRELVDLAACQLPDMRLIKNVRNEFVIFREKILRDKESVPGLNEGQLFAMMLYKSTHLSDFEATKNGESKLDLLYADSRRLVTANLASLAFESRSIRQRIMNLNSVASRSEKLGGDLQEYIERVARQFSISNRAVRTVTFAGQTRSFDDLRSAGFWQEFIEAGNALTVQFDDRYHTGQTHRLNMSRADISDTLGDSLSIDDWHVSDEVKLYERLNEIVEEQAFLAHADMGDLMKCEKFTLSSGDGGPKSFRQLANEHLDSELARQLVEAGYINRDFTLYTSTYYAELVSSQAMNFLIHNIASNETDAHFALTSDDVQAVLRERGDSVLRERGIFNIDVLDHLLEVNDSRVDVLIERLTTFGDDEQLFLQTYLSGGKQQVPLISKLVDRWGLSFRFIVTEAAIDETMRMQLVNTAVENMVTGINYVVDERMRTYFEEHYSDLDVFVSSETSAEVASHIAGLLTAMGARLASLAPLGAGVRQAVIGESRYAITRDNLMIASGGTQDLALDSVRGHNPTVYAYVLNHLTDYLIALDKTEPKSPTIKDADAFGAIIEDVLEHADDLLPAVVASASPDCQVSNLTDVSNFAWPVLAEHVRFPATFENVTAYMDAIGRVDIPLALLLTAVGSITVPPDSDESKKEALALRLLVARDTLPDPEVRINLVLDLNLAESLPATSIKPESGKLLGLLIEKDIIADDAESFALALDSDWQTREFVISKSTQFSSFMTRTEVPTSDVAQLMKSKLVPDSVKEVILNRVDEFVPTNDRQALTAIALFADSKRERLPIELVARMATSQVDSQLVLRVIQPLLPELTELELAPVLSAIGGVYSTMSERKGKRPKMMNTKLHLALVKKLEELDLVSSYQVRGEEIIVNMKRD